jgi:hypothetical protein
MSFISSLSSVSRSESRSSHSSSYPGGSYSASASTSYPGGSYSASTIGYDAENYHVGSSVVSGSARMPRRIATNGTHSTVAVIGGLIALTVILLIFILLVVVVFRTLRFLTHL